MRLGIASAYPPAPSGPADYVAELLPALAARAEIVCLAPEPDEVSPQLRETYDVRPLAARDGVDLVVYHAANNPYHLDVVTAAMDGPPGMVVVHDASLHHLLAGQLLDSGRADDYGRLVRRAHGPDGATVGELRARGERGEIELFVYDMLGPVLETQLGAIVHNAYGRFLVEDRCPGLPVWVIPHFAIGAAPAVSKSDLGLDPQRFVVVHLGFVTPAKRPELVLEAFARLRGEGVDAQLVFAGEDQTWGPLQHHIDRLALRRHVVVTGYVAESELDAYAAAADAVVSLRWPHVGESSGTLMRSLKAGRPVVVQDVGSWAELPADAVVRAGGAGDEAEAVAAALFALASDADLRNRVSAAARAYAESVGDADSSAERQVRAAAELLERPRTPPRDVIDSREAAVREFVGAGPGRMREAIVSAGGTIARQLVDEHLDRYHATFGELPAAHPGARLLDVGSYPAVLRLMACVWGYDVRACGHAVESTSRVEIPPSAGLPAYTAVYDAVDVEIDPFPYETGSFDVACCWEVLEHLGRDPMHMLAELNRVLRPNGLLILTTPNVVSARSVRAVVTGYHPFLWSLFWRSASRDRHNREYTPREVRQALDAAGFSTDRVFTKNVWGGDDPEMTALLEQFGTADDRGDIIIARARKVTLPGERYPEVLYR